MARIAIFELLSRIGGSVLLLGRISIQARENSGLTLALVFGGKSGCRIYNRFGGVLAYILRTHGFLPAPADLVGLFQCLVRYLDDHRLIARSLEEDHNEV